MNNTMKFLIDLKNDGKRLDVFLTNKLDQLTRTSIKKIIETNNVKINKIVSILPSKKIKKNDVVEIKIVAPKLEKPVFKIFFIL